MQLDNSGRGFIFSTESDYDDNDHIYFTIPIKKGLLGSREISTYLNDFRLVMPCLKDDRYVELVAKLEYPYLIIRIEGIDIDIILRVVDDLYFDRFFRMWHPLEYVGSLDYLGLDGKWMLAFLPVDAKQLDILYDLHKIVIVGFTSSFNSMSFDSNRYTKVREMIDEVQNGVLEKLLAKTEIANSNSEPHKTNIKLMYYYVVPLFLVIAIIVLIVYLLIYVF